MDKNMEYEVEQERYHEHKQNIENLLIFILIVKTNLSIVWNKRIYFFFPFQDLNAQYLS